MTKFNPKDIVDDTITITKDEYNELKRIAKVGGCIECFKYEVHISALQAQLSEYADFFEKQVLLEEQQRLVKYPT